MLTWEETARLARSPVIDIGAHTHTHPDAFRARAGRTGGRDLAGGAMRCVPVPLDREPTAFAYPYGGSVRLYERDRSHRA